MGLRKKKVKPSAPSLFCSVLPGSLDGIVPSSAHLCSFYPPTWLYFSYSISHPLKLMHIDH